MTLAAFLALAARLQLSVDMFCVCPHRAQQQTRRPPLLTYQRGRRTDGRWTASLVVLYVVDTRFEVYQVDGN